MSSIEPSYHVKIYAINIGDFQADRQVDLSSFGLETVHREDNIDENISVLVLQEIVSPKWSKGNTLQNISNHLIVVYFDTNSSLLFINSTIKKSIEFYELILRFYCEEPDAKLLSDRELNSVLANIDDAEFFNIGMRNRSHYGTNESYRIITGSTAHLSIDKRDANNFHRGHLFGKGVEDGSKITIGLSSSSKVWSQRSSNLFSFIVWARGLAHKINEQLEGRTNTPIDDLPTSISLTELPDKDVVVVNWHESAFRNFIQVKYNNGSSTVSLELTDIILSFNHQDSDKEHYRISLQSDHFLLPVVFSFNYDDYFISENEVLSKNILVYRNDNDKGIGIIEYLNLCPLIFYYSDFSLLYNSYQYLEEPKAINLFSLDYLDDSIDWETQGVNIENECSGNDSIHECLKKKLSDARLPFSYYDHGTGEVADFVTAEMDTDEILIKLYHCKGSLSKRPGNRVDDIYEVMCQCIKSSNFTNYRKLIKKLEQRQRGKILSGLCCDNVSILQDFITQNRGMKVAFQIVLVQPGITKSGVEERILNLLSAANSTIRNTNNCRNMLAITSV